MTSDDRQKSYAGTRPEALLALSSIRPRRSAADRAAVSSLVESGMDWDRLLALAKHHGIMPLVYVCLKETESDRIPRETLDRLRGFYDENRWRNMTLLKELLAILDAFGRERIRAIPIKGPLLARTLYGNLGLRWIADLDILVHRDDVLRVRPLLEERGFSPDRNQADPGELLREGREWEWAFFSDDMKIRVEIQWRTMPEYLANYECLDEGVWDRTVPAEVGGVEIQCLTPEDAFLYACMHGGEKHLWNDMRFLVDMGRMLQCDWDVDWNLVWQKAGETGTTKSLELGLYLAVVLAGAELPAPLEEKVRFTRQFEAVGAMVRSRFFRDNYGLPGYREWSHYLRAAPGVPGPSSNWNGGPMQLLRYVRTILTPEVKDRAFGQGVVRKAPLLSYIYRPVRLFKKHGSKLFRRLG